MRNFTKPKSTNKIYKTILTLLFTAFLQLAFGQTQNPLDTITALEASQRIGQQVIVKGKVISTFYATNSNGKPTFLNLDKDFPNNPIVVIIFENELKKLNINAQIYKGKTVIVKGKMELYRDEEKPNKNKPNIKIYSIDQIKIVN